MLPPRARPLALLAAAASAQWDTLCANATGGPYSAWSETRCPSATATCCPSGFNPSGVGCCPFPNAVCCPGSQFACCPAGTKCTLAAGGGYDARYNCTAVPGGAVSINKATCKGGPPLPMSTTLKNVLSVWMLTRPPAGLRVGECARSRRAETCTQRGRLLLSALRAATLSRRT